MQNVKTLFMCVFICWIQFFLNMQTHLLHVPVAAVLVLNTPDDGSLRPKHVESPCRNKTCTVLHQVGVSFDLYYDARKHKIIIYWLYWCLWKSEFDHFSFQSLYCCQKFGFQLSIRVWNARSYTFYDPVVPVSEWR